MNKKETNITTEQRTNSVSMNDNGYFIWQTGMAFEQRYETTDGNKTQNTKQKK